MTANRNTGEMDSRKAICCLMVLEIADYDAKPVFDQIRLTQHLRKVLSDTMAHAGADDVVSIVREQGAVLSFLSDPEECFTTALAIREATLNQHCYRDLLLRIGINLGSVEIARDAFDNPYVSGAGRRDADRVMRQGPPRQISVTRPFFEVLSRAAPELAGTLEYQGVFSDTLGPPLGVHRLSAPSSGELPNPSSPTIARLSSQSTGVLRPANAKRSMQVTQSARNEPRRVQRLHLRYVLLALLLGAAVLASSSRFRVEVTGLVPAPQLAAAVTETPMPRADVPDAGPSAAAPSAAARNMQQRAASEPATEKPTRKASTRVRRGQDLAVVSERAARLEPSHEQPEHAARLEPTHEAERPIDRSAEVQAAPASDPATLLLAVRPWGEVYVDGAKMGVTPPLKKLQVAPGQRLITIKNSFLPEYRVRLSVYPDAQVTIAHDFSCVSNRERRCWEEISKGLAPQSRLRFKTVEAEPQTVLR